MQKKSENFVWRIKRNYDRTFKNQASAIKTIEKILSRIAESIHGRGIGTLSSFTEMNPRGLAHGQSGITKALADLGASISLMPYSMFLRLNLGDLKPTRMCIEHANKTTQFPKGIAKNVMIGNKLPLLIGCKFRIDREKSTPKLKELPSHLEYAFLDDNHELPVIISSLLFDQEKRLLLEILTKHKKALAWKISDIKGISPSFCTHKILMEENSKPTVQPQRRLNPKVQDVIKIEILKLLDAGLIYAILDSPWVSPTHVVPKKGGTIVTTNKDNELISTRTVTG
ncbi:reverse transcriptase domain-containing protein [Tanacetum coccineum]